MNRDEELLANFLKKNEVQITKFRRAIEALEVQNVPFSSDTSVDQDVRNWLDSEGPTLDWQHGSGLTADEWFFITTLYGNMTEDGQRTIIRKFFGPLLVTAAKRDISNFQPDTPGYSGLRYPWMRSRLCKMANVLRNNGYSMQKYVDQLRLLDQEATVQIPMPALDKIVEDHRATRVKTLSVFVRDCVRGNCFPIDLRVEYQLIKYGLRRNEKFLVQMSLAINRNPRELARLFYEADPDQTDRG